LFEKTYINMDLGLIPFKTVGINSTPNSKGLYNQSYNGGAFSINISGANVRNRSHRRVKAGITSATIPLTYYGINSSNNTLIFNEGATQCTATIPVGQYSSTSAPTAIATAMTTASANTITYAVTLSTDTGKFTFSQNSVSITTTLNTTNSTCQVPLGLGYSVLSAFGNTVKLTAPNIANLIGPTVIHIRCTNIVSDYYEAQTQSPSTILAVIPIVGNQFDSLVYIPAFPKNFGDVSGRLDSLTFNITDEFGNTIDFNGYGVKFDIAFYALLLDESDN
jgi:hypothetical protein